ncbi:NAD(P)H-dependent oxidoreductase [Flagellatimonas centrodinii]|uniref:NAD(P)H-dependent oxidoreductase n=1 Tax=Flagellatimonas centrodinii TaxID=2806210 RepID=UPI001FED9B9D|nr:NAD(P)H-dependent oxidoreductase [Flagellatimonas centrodinii]ULQ45130.1 NAD(P)H-dependent oxidoreductase [Flagellatimonas centrodinii]
MKTLLVTFTPRTGSHTARLVAHARQHIRGDIDLIDLARRPVAMLDTAAVDAYVKRNYGGQTLAADEAAALAVQDADVAKVLAADVLMLASPMHNFAMPGPLKAFLDGIIQKGRTWDADANGYRGLMTGRRALALFSSGGVYGDGGGDHYSPLARTLFGFMGYSEAEVISAQGTSRDAAQAVASAQAALDALLPRWYVDAV